MGRFALGICFSLGFGAVCLGICFSLGFGAVCGAKCFKTRVLGHAALASDFFAGILLFLLLARVWGGLPWVSASPSGLGRFALGIWFSLGFGAVCGAKCFKTSVLGHAALASHFFAGNLLFLLLARVWGGLPWVSASPSGLGRFALGIWFSLGFGAVCGAKCFKTRVLGHAALASDVFAVILLFLLLAEVWGGLSASPSGLGRFALGICFSLGFGAVCGAKCFKTRVLGHSALASDFFAGILLFLLLPRVWGGLPWVSASPSGLGRFALGIWFSLGFGAVCGAKCLEICV